RDADCHCVDDAEHRLGEPYRCDSIRPELGDPEHVHHGEHRLQDHLQHHRNREQENGAPDGALGEVLPRAAKRFLDGSPESARSLSCGYCGLVWYFEGSAHWQSTLRCEVLEIVAKSGPVGFFGKALAPAQRLRDADDFSGGDAAVRHLDACAGHDSPEQVLAKKWLTVALLRMPEGGVPRLSAAGNIVTPGDRMISHVTALVAALVHGRQNVHAASGVGLEVVPFVRALPRLRQTCGGGMIRVLDLNAAGLNRGMAAEKSPNQVSVPGPVVLSIRRRVDSDVAISAFNVALKSGLLAVVEDRPGRAQENHHLIVAQLVVGEEARVLGGVHVEAVRRPKLSDGVIPLGMEVWRYPVVFEKISAEKMAPLACAARLNTCELGEHAD